MPPEIITITENSVAANAKAQMRYVERSDPGSGHTPASRSQKGVVQNTTPTMLPNIAVSFLPKRRLAGPATSSGCR